MAKLEARMMGRELKKNLESEVAQNEIRDDIGKKYFGFSDMASPRYAAGDRGQQAVDIAEKMRAAARMSEIEGDIMKSSMPSEYESNNSFIGPINKQQQVGFSGSLYDAAKKTVDWEGRRDKNGYLDVYQLPSGDMGGSYEIAGINNKYHPEAAKALKEMNPKDRDEYAAKYIMNYTSPVTSKLPEEYGPFFQDLAFNRGLSGSVKLLQRAIGLNDDGVIGQKTLDRLSQENPVDVMKRVSAEQLRYEKRLIENNPERGKFLPGLENRIKNRYALFGMA
ncbi:MAG: hypothetical protein EBR82_54745 [Caulobacteraceae bacterium]|nr:hypothetical protein [Caulobacteraceae bacterium]